MEDTAAEGRNSETEEDEGRRSKTGEKQGDEKRLGAENVEQMGGEPRRSTERREMITQRTDLASMSSHHTFDTQ